MQLSLLYRGNDISYVKHGHTIFPADLLAFGMGGDSDMPITKITISAFETSRGVPIETVSPNGGGAMNNLRAITDCA
jgi:hypothetical protein